MSTGGPKKVVPIIAVESVDEIRRFYVEILGFDHVSGVRGSDGRIAFCTIAKDGARLMLARHPEGDSRQSAPGGKKPVSIYLEVTDVERYCDELTRRRVHVTDPLTTQWWGDRTFKVMDPNGYELWFYQTVDTPRPPSGADVF